MILVDIQIPVLDMIMDFEINEEANTGWVTKQVLEMVYNRKQERQLQSEVYLFALGKGGVLNPAETLRQQGIRSGESLIII